MNIIQLLYMDKNTDIKKIEKIQDLYSNLTYFDNYGNSVILFIIITLILFFTVSYCFIKTHIKSIKKNWVSERCKPYIAPFAGMINKPDNMTAGEYTEQNFTFCAQEILKDISGFLIDPITFIVSALQATEEVITQDIQSLRAAFEKYRRNIQRTFVNLLQVMQNFTLPLITIIAKFEDIVARMQGVFFTFMYSFFSVIMTFEGILQMALNGISVFMILLTILMIFAIGGLTTAIVLLFDPITFAIGTTMFYLFLTQYLAILGTYVGILVPLIFTLEFAEGLGMHTFLDPAPPPQAPSCFDKNTLIKMNDGSEKKMIDIEVGDVLIHDNMVTTKLKLFADGNQMYSLNNVIVSGSHSLKEENRWIKVEDHAESVKIDYNEKYIYCLNTQHKEIIINDTIFCDWDELFEDDIETIKITHKTNKYNTNNEKNAEFNFKYADIHKYFDGGFIGETKINLLNGEERQIKDIEINDILENGEKVYGLVEIDGKNVNGHYIYNLGKLNTEIIGGPNLNLCDKNLKFTTTINLDSKIKIDIKENKLYHLLTDKKTFIINKLRFYDYNATIELILDKYRGKLLSMKYV